MRLRSMVAVAALIGAMAVAGPAGANSQATGIRVAGADRIATSIAVSQATFPNGSRSVLLARDDDFADALAGTPLAVQTFGPILLTPTTSLDSRVEAEIRRLLPPGNTVYILGESGAVSDAVANQVQGDGYSVVRYGGPDRFATAVAVANAVVSPKAVLLATGLNPGDALAGGPAAVAAGGIVLLTNDGVMPASTQAYLTQHSSLPVFALGGPAAQADPQATAIAGPDRYATSVLVAQKFFAAPAFLGFANGFAFPDALSGGVATAEGKGPLLLVAPDVLPEVVHQYVVGVSPSVTTAEIYGGPNVIPDGVLAAIDSAIRGN